jgi:acyl-CoA synthetase (AMP-forming)/AMP-acid ligase II
LFGIEAQVIDEAGKPITHDNQAMGEIVLRGHWIMEEGIAKGKIISWMLPDFVGFYDESPKTSVGKFDKIAIRKRLDEFLEKAKKMSG